MGPPSLWRAGSNVERWAADHKVFEPCCTLYIRFCFGVGGAIGNLPNEYARQGQGTQFSIATAMAAPRLIDSRHGH